MSFDILAYDEGIQARLREIAPELKKVASADDVDDALYRSTNLPAGFTLYDGAKGQGRHVARDPAQFLIVRASIVLVAKSLRGTQDARQAMYPLIKLVKEGINDWRSDQCETAFSYESDDFMQRLREKVAWEVTFSARAYDDFKS